MKGFKKLVALGVVATMVIGSSVTAFATETTQNLSSDPAGGVAGAEQTVTGEGTENYINKKVFKVVAPTQALEDAIFDFITDPQGLIVETEAAQIGEVEIAEDTGVFFKNKDEEGNVVAISGTSDPLRLINKSTSGVSIAVKVKLKEATSDKYAGGYSTTADFTGSGDSSKGLYLGLASTGNAVKPLTDTQATFSNYAKSAYELFAVTWDSEATTPAYAFDIPAENADAAPVYEFTVSGALNRVLADTTWYKVTDGKPLQVGAALAMPDIELIYTPSYVDARQCLAAYGDTGIVMWNYDDTMFAEGDAIATTTVSDVKINDVAVASVTALAEDGTILVPYTAIYTALGITGDAANVDTLVERLQGVQATVGGIAMYANITP